MKCDRRIFYIAFIMFFSLLFSGCESKEEAYNDGYQEGFLKGLNDAVTESEKELEKRKIQNEKIYVNKKNEYERLVIQAYDNAYKEGQDSMQKDLDEVVNIQEVNTETVSPSKKKTRKTRKKS